MASAYDLNMLSRSATGEERWGEEEAEKLSTERARPFMEFARTALKSNPRIRRRRRRSFWLRFLVRSHSDVQFYCPLFSRSPIHP